MASDLATLKAERDRLKKCSQRLDAERAEMAALLAEVQAERDRLDAEGAEALKGLTLLREAEARAAVGEDVVGLCDWPTHKRTAAKDPDGTVDEAAALDTGRGWVVVRAPDAGTAAAALAPGATVGAGGLSLYDATPAGIKRVLLKAVVLAPDVPVKAAKDEEARREAMIDRLCCEAPGLAAAATRAALGLAGLWAAEARGK